MSNMYESWIYAYLQVNKMLLSKMTGNARIDIISMRMTGVKSYASLLHPNAEII